MKIRTKLLGVVGTIVLNILVTHFAIQQAAANSHGQILVFVLVASCLLVTGILANHAHEMMERAPKPIESNSLTFEELKELEESDYSSPGLSVGGNVQIRPLPNVGAEELTNADLTEMLKDKKEEAELLDQDMMEEATLRMVADFGAPVFDRYEIVEDTVYFYDGTHVSMIIPKEAWDQYLESLERVKK
jgi:hypothetical protein